MFPEDIGLCVNWASLEIKEIKGRKRILREKKYIYIYTASTKFTMGHFHDDLQTVKIH